MKAWEEFVKENGDKLTKEVAVVADSYGFTMRAEVTESDLKSLTLKVERQYALNGWTEKTIKVQAYDEETILILWLHNRWTQVHTKAKVTYDLKLVAKEIIRAYFNGISLD